MQDFAMVDLETLDTGPNAVVTSIGIARFNIDEGVGCIAHYPLDYTTDIRGTISPQTLRWWLQQSAQAQLELHGKMSIHEALHEARCELQRCSQVWANAPTFDCTILRNLFERHDLKAPWHFRDERCCRTLFDIGLNTFNMPWPQREGVYHNAVDDAVYQAQFAVQILRRLRDARAE